jgi:hypothetical protein
MVAGLTFETADEPVAGAGTTDVDVDLTADTAGSRRIDLWVSVGVVLAVVLVWIFFA